MKKPVHLLVSNKLRTIFYVLNLHSKTKIRAKNLFSKVFLALLLPFQIDNFYDIPHVK